MHTCPHLVHQQGSLGVRRPSDDVAAESNMFVDAEGDVPPWPF